MKHFVFINKIKIKSKYREIQMQFSQNKLIRLIHGSIPDGGHAKHSSYFTSRPATTSKIKLVSIDKNKSIDGTQGRQSASRVRKDYSQIDFKRDKFLYESKYNSIVHYDSIDSNPKSQAMKSPMQNTYRPVIMDNIKVSISKYQNLINSTNDIMKNIVRQQIISQLIIKDPIMKKINKNLVESLIMIGKIRTYEDEEIIPKIQNLIGFIIYGRMKIYNQDYKNYVERGDTVGENVVFNFNIALKAKCLQDSCIFWLPYKYYSIMREESIKNGLKNQFNQLEIILRLSFIKKRYKEHLKKIHL